MINCSGKALWSFVCGNNILPSDEVVAEELEAAKCNLQDGLLLYNHFSQEDHDKWSAGVKLKDNQKQFVLRLAKMLVSIIFDLVKYFEKP